MMSVLLDLNILLDLFLEREPWRGEAGAIWQANHEGRITAHLASFSVPTLYYIIQKQLGDDPARRAVDRCLVSLSIIATSRFTIENTFVLNGPDFEDDLQIAAAKDAGLDAIVTRDLGGFIHSPVQPLSPGELLTLIATGTSRS